MPQRNANPLRRTDVISRRDLLKWGLSAGVLAGVFSGCGPFRRPLAASAPRITPLVLRSRQQKTWLTGALSAASTLDPLISGLTAAQQVGQLFMVGVWSDSLPDPVTASGDAIGRSNAGNVVLYGTGWDSRDAVLSVTASLQALAADANAGAGLFICGNQEGGQAGTFQAFYGPGFSAIPTAVDMAQEDAASLEAAARGWAEELLNAGVNLNLAPVLDTVPLDMIETNAPIGAREREFGNTPADVTTHGIAFERGMRAAQVGVTLKHFPGLGRVTGNTDFTATGISDAAFTGAGDPYLQPFQAGIDAGAEFVMVSLAIYPQVDTQQAVFSSAIMRDILRGEMGFANVIISDDLGAAAAVADRAPEQRALDFLRAGGDMVLTVRPSDIAPMTEAVLNEMDSDPAFATQILDSVARVLRVKRGFGLLP